MGVATPVILNIEVPEYQKIIIECSDGRRYYSNLAPMGKVFCFPVSLKEWKNVAVDSYGLGLIWTSRFEMHVDQIIEFAEKVEPVNQVSA